MSVYFIRDGHDRVKIGVTRDKTAAARLAHIQIGNADRLVVTRFITGAGPAAERWFHNHYADRHIGGEWFRWCDTMLTLEPSFADTPKSVDERRLERKRIASLGRKTSESQHIDALVRRATRYLCRTPPNVAE